MTTISEQNRVKRFSASTEFAQDATARVKLLRLGIGLSLVAAMWAASPTSAVAALTVVGGPTVSQAFGDDVNTSTLYADSPGALPLQYTNSCPWVNNGLTAAGFTPANGWNFSYYNGWTPAQQAAFFTDLTVTTYQPWVVSMPGYTDPNGTDWGGGFFDEDGNLINGNQYEAGGAKIVLSFNPVTVNDPLKGSTNFHWIQGLMANYRGNTGNSTSTGRLDADATKGPFYDQSSAAGIKNGVGYFADIPGATEAEFEGNPVADVQFQVFLAVDTQVMGGAANRANGGADNVTIYGGEWWGYQYTAVDTPEPAACIIWALLGGVGITVGYRRKQTIA